MKAKIFLAAIICLSLAAVCFSQTREYPKEIRGYKVERAAVELKPRENQKVTKSSQQTPGSHDNSSTDGTGASLPAPISSASPDPDPSVDHLITFASASLARFTPLGITLNMPVVGAPIRQSGHVDFLLFEEMIVNGNSITIDEYHRGFDLPTKKPLTLREPLRFFISLPTAAVAVIGEEVKPQEMWPVTGRVYVCGKY